MAKFLQYLLAKVQQCSPAPPLYVCGTEITTSVQGLQITGGSRALGGESGPYLGQKDKDGYYAA